MSYEKKSEIFQIFLQLFRLVCVDVLTLRMIPSMAENQDLCIIITFCEAAFAVYLFAVWSFSCLNLGCIL